MYDIYLSMGCRTEPDLSELNQEAPELALPEVHTRMMKRSPGPGFLQLNLSETVARKLIRRLKAARATGYVIDAAYRQPRVTVQQALPIAEDAIAELHKTHFTNYEFGPVRFFREQPFCWTFSSGSEQLVKEGVIPGAFIVSIDKLDAHVWQPDEFERLYEDK